MAIPQGHGIILSRTAKDHGCAIANLVAYDGLSALRMEDCREGFVRLRLLDGARGRWHNVPVQGPPYAAAVSAQSHAEKERMAEQRAAQSRRMAE